MRVVAAQAEALEEVVASQECVIVTGEGELRGDAAASLLFADYAVMRPGASLHLDSAAAWAGVVWRLGDRAAHFRPDWSAEECLAAGLCDHLGEFAAGPRSEAALDAAAVLISRRGGDRAERAEFARLFASGIPREGLTAFLEKRRPQFTSRPGGC
jgi:hypothetical protein